MSSSHDFDDRLAVIAEFTPLIDNEIDGEIEGHVGSGAPLEGFRCLHGSHDYLAFTSPGWEYINIRKTLNVDALWHVRMNQSGTDSGRFEVTQDEADQARRELEGELQGQPPTEKRELRLNLKQILCREGCTASFDTTNDPLNIHGYSVDKKIFPEQGEFCIAEYAKSVQNVVNFVWVGQDLIEEYYGLAPSSGGASDFRIQ